MLARSFSRGFTLVELLVVVAIIAVLAAIVFPVFKQARAKGWQALCMSNQRQMALNAVIYAQDNNDKLPAAETVWTSLNLPDEMFVCPAAGNDDPISYVYKRSIAGKRLGMIINMSATILFADGKSQDHLYSNINDLDPRHVKKIIVAFADGHVELRTTDSMPRPILMYDYDNHGIATMWLDETAPTLLPKHYVYQTEANWDSDGRRIVFIYETELDYGNPAAYEQGVGVMNDDGSDFQPLTNGNIDNKKFDYTPLWSPDGLKILFRRDFTNQSDHGKLITQNDQYIMNADGTGERLLANGSYSSQPWRAGWDKMVLTVGEGTDDAEIYLFDINGSEMKNLTNNPAFYTDAVIQPDGKLIPFRSNRAGTDDNRFDIYIMDSEGKNVHRLTDLPGYEYARVWNHKGTKLAITIQRDPSVSNTVTDAGVVNVDGTSLINLTESLQASRSDKILKVEPVAWSSDDRQLLMTVKEMYDANAIYKSSIFLVNADGSGLMEVEGIHGKIKACDW